METIEGERKRKEVSVQSHHNIQLRTKPHILRRVVFAELRTHYNSAAQ